MNGENEDVCELCGFTNHDVECPRRKAFADCGHADFVLLGHCSELGGGSMWGCNDCDASGPGFEMEPPKRWFDSWEEAVKFWWDERR